MKKNIEQLCGNEINPVEITSIDYDNKDLNFEEKINGYFNSISGSLLGLVGLNLIYNGISSEKDIIVIEGSWLLAMGLTLIGDGIAGTCIESLIDDYKQQMEEKQ